ncbi:hypothetical protein E2542_SST24829 [Spatholobus suberectus]|nr:hypothetical protein E2542_SST24829 [Spatholobus suberectus]
MVADALSNKRENEACDPAKSLKLSTLEQQNNRGQFEQHETTSSPFGCQQNHERFDFAGAAVKMEENNAIIGETFPNQDSTIMQLMLLEIDQESETPIAWQNQQESYPWPDLAFQNDLSFQYDPSFPLWSFDYGSTLVEGHTETLGNALNWESSMCQMGNENPRGAENGGVSSGGFGSIGFHSMEPNIQEFEAPNLQVALGQRYEPLQHGFETNTNSQGKNIVVNDLNIISQYLNLNSPNIEDQETTNDDWTDFMNELWSKIETDMLIDLWFNEDGTQL